VDLDDAGQLFAPLQPEQALHLLDVMTWFPDGDSAKWEKIAKYIAANASIGLPPTPATCREVTERLLGQGPAIQDSAEGRWQDIPNAKWMYQVKYDLMSLLYPDDWFTFMNMGYAEPDFVPETASQPEEEIWSFARTLYRRVVGQIDLAGLDVLEVGSGRGGGAVEVATRWRPRTMVGLDAAPNNVAFCRRRHGNACGDRLTFQQGDAENLPFADASFDAVLNIESAHCYPHVERFFREVRRVLRPGGLLLFADEWWASQRTRPRELLVETGFQIEAQEDLTVGVIRALRLLQGQAKQLLATMPQGPGRAAYERFFGERVCQQSAYSYTSGRFVFLQILAARL
jgi:SAM-dependent methyltransferase